MSFIIRLAVLILNFIVGAWCVSDTVTSFKNKKYFLFGLNLIFSLICVFWIAKYIFVIL